MIRQQAEAVQQVKESEMNVLTENIHPVGKNGSNESVDSEFNCDHDTTHSKSNDLSSENIDSDKLFVAPKKVYPAKSGVEEFSKKRNSDKSHQSRKTKRKYFTKYMSNEFSKDALPVTMSMMDEKTQSLFKDKEYNDLVSEITGMF